ncbi:hypothetical protein RRG08_037353 [Elysia crispata]|uniref:Uncharacterized protein n=1 Tax=Elysia crispata TaxID=231223 RepID=A0AAE1DVV9_9GAST|nr:hypothetical protein RRG08_037353 [Elysia crispata]
MRVSFSEKIKHHRFHSEDDLQYQPIMTKMYVLLVVLLILTAAASGGRPSDSDFCSSDYCDRHAKFRTKINGKEVCCKHPLHGYMVVKTYLQNGKTVQTCYCSLSRHR